MTQKKPNKNKSAVVSTFIAGQRESSAARSASAPWDARPKGELSVASDGADLGSQSPVAKDSAKSITPWVYTEIVKDHFLNPRNFLMGDESQFTYDAVGLVGNPVCGDQMKMFLKIDQKTDTITDVAWKTYGCASAIASTSALSELVKGKTLAEALEIGPKEINDFLGGLPEHKFHCSILGHEALRAAIENYRAKA